MNKKVIVDCDGGYDDAVSLILMINAHKKKSIDLKAITCVTGNTDIDNVVKNVSRILDACDSKDIPVYRGADSSLISIESLAVKATEVRYHGHDGFGDVFTDEVDVSYLQKDHAVIALHKLITDNPNEISVVCLAPLTNIALAIKIYPDILKNVKDFYIMGGNSAGLGNTTPQAEFNFYADPESAHILLQSNIKPLWLFPWETCLKSDITIEWRENELGKLKENKKLKLIKTVEDGIYKNKIKRQVYRPCDAFCASAFINPEVIKDYNSCNADVELQGLKTRGFVAIDHLETKKPNINLVTDLDFEEFKTLMLDAFQ
ncbi:inosine-uridine preferring nucleoside hydrolase-like isoform X1 [Microplitis mediator]|uniref:inosine-uridine preferring nucleoside hydrolase-like isoform X1 n=1 Tax=Microplitis mediator TaxID=375433 RepID=UPI002556ABF5|nr:inosine-uridine preferring nucleoside hydrolase-like isoform X1 [Microplitis mediator]XP_057335853.1 inosine-uridine preferring nucleoside hydrolase-like isoform X1 [Microplitis mediator]XP_057335854.1 inosine-uridine preferring nucleoside hydrolase-like isoform X1 [Microplitis mediator]